MNAHAEQFNRTLQEQFVDYHEDLLFDDLAALNWNMADWLRADHIVLLPSEPRSPISGTISHATSTRVPKVVDPYRFLYSHLATRYSRFPGNSRRWDNCWTFSHCEPVADNLLIDRGDVMKLKVIIHEAEEGEY